MNYKDMIKKNRIALLHRTLKEDNDSLPADYDSWRLAYPKHWDDPEPEVIGYDVGNGFIDKDFNIVLENYFIKYAEDIDAEENKGGFIKWEGITAEKFKKLCLKEINSNLIKKNAPLLSIDDFKIKRIDIINDFDVEFYEDGSLANAEDLYFDIKLSVKEEVLSRYDSKIKNQWFFENIDLEIDDLSEYTFHFEEKDLLKNSMPYIEK